MGGQEDGARGRFHKGDARPAWDEIRAAHNTALPRTRRINQSLFAGVLPKPGNMEIEALDRREVTSKAATLEHFNVAATLESRGPGFGQHALTSAAREELNLGKEKA
jgi:hypothetical protein